MTIAIYLWQPHLIYHPSKNIRFTPADIGLEYEDVNFTAFDGTNLHGWFVPAGDAKGTVLICHGNAGNISGRLDTIRIFDELGFDSFIFDYRGYGKSAGAPDEEGTYLDAMAAWDYLTDKRNIPEDKIVIFGRSLGAAIAAYLASEVDPRAVILESGFTSIPDMASKIYWYLPARHLSRFYYPTAKHAARIDAPVLVIHSSEDELIPYSHGQKTFEAANEPKKLFTMTGSHNDGFLINRNPYKNAIEKFLGENP